jgi:acetyl esterase/lipase
MKKLIFTLLIFMFESSTAQKTIPLYEGVPPGTIEGINAKEFNTNADKKGAIACLRNITLPTLTLYKPKIKTTDAAIIICPGGGYYIVAKDFEGDEIAKWYADRGMTAYVLKYRLPQRELFTNAEIRPLQDAQQAMRYVRSMAKNYGIDSNKIGIMGFSAGGHLASTASTHYDAQVGEIVDKSVSVRPDFSVLIYPVISFSSDYGHLGSRDNLLGSDTTEQKIKYYSNELRVNDNTPPAFLLHAFDDRVNVNNSIEYYKALKKAGVPAEMHLYDKGDHGFGLTSPKVAGPINQWDKRLEDWLLTNKFLTKEMKGKKANSTVIK